MPSSPSLSFFVVVNCFPISSSLFFLFSCLLIQNQIRIETHKIIFKLDSKLKKNSNCKINYPDSYYTKIVLQLEIVIHGDRSNKQYIYKKKKKEKPSVRTLHLLENLRTSSLVQIWKARLKRSNGGN